jgi:hypothetical protein
VTVGHVLVHVEEPSMEAALRHLLPKLLGTDLTFQIFLHNGKPALLRICRSGCAATRATCQTDHRIVVIIDRDRDDCARLKATLDGFARDAGLTVRSDASGQFQVVNRLAIEELEAWYFGDWAAVRAAYPRVGATIDKKSAYRDPDQIAGGTAEAFARVLSEAGYFRTGLRKLEAAQTIAPHLDPARNRSPSFAKLRQVCDELRALA